MEDPPATGPGAAPQRKNLKDLKGEQAACPTNWRSGAILPTNRRCRTNDEILAAAAPLQPISVATVQGWAGTGRVYSKRPHLAVLKGYCRVLGLRDDVAIGVKIAISMILAKLKTMKGGKWPPPA